MNNTKWLKATALAILLAGGIFLLQRAQAKQQPGPVQSTKPAAQKVELPQHQPAMAGIWSFSCVTAKRILLWTVSRRTSV